MATTLTLRQQDELQVKIDERIKQMTLTNDDWWRIKWRGKFIVVRSGNHQWQTRNKAIAAFKAYVRNDWVLLDYYLEIRDNNPKHDWNYLRDNHVELSHELVAFLMSTNQVEFVQVKS